ncbi:MAG TPA: MerR family transcriptional regulator [Thermoanaerobaculia bacterium]|nr:MerR family transcriptional regulator [Thermoanaerobaculia bacterium]HUM30867.1 MerR family transcriptional regulator [Thermoanaerobaculia bacterium]HXK69232.1 MerR family transcriptional regulator [Thermoanaerobaculia bacterium]
MTDQEIPDRLYFKIGDVCRIAKIQPYVLRYWETEFPQLAPSKSKSGQRVYSREDLDIILKIKNLLYEEGYTIAGAKKQLETNQEVDKVEGEDVQQFRNTLGRVLKQLIEVKKLIS